MAEGHPHRSLGQRPRNPIEPQDSWLKAIFTSASKRVFMAVSQLYRIPSPLLGRCPRLRCFWPSANPKLTRARRKSVRVLFFCSLLLATVGCEQTPVFPSGFVAPEVVEERGPLKVSAVEPKRVSSQVKQHVFYGRLAATNAEVLGFGTSGRIASLPKNGAEFQAGDTIAALENDELIAQRDAVSRQLQGNQDPAQANTLGNQLAEINRRLGAGQIVAPFDGVVARSFTAVGEVAQERRPIVQLYQNGQPIVIADVPLRIVNQLSEAGTLACRIAEREISCVAQSISESPDVMGAVEVQFSLDSDLNGVDWSYDQTIELRLSNSREVNAFTVPAASLLSSVSTPWSVLRIDSTPTPDGSRITPLAVELIERQGDECLVSGELGGTTIVASGTHRVVAGQVVNPVYRPTDAAVRPEGSP